MTDITKLIFDLAVPGVKDLMPYRPGKPIEELQRELGVKQVIKLASNENPLGPSPVAMNAIQAQISELARYPDGNGFVLKTALSEVLNVSADCITLGNGSNDVLELLARAFVSSDDQVIFSKYAFMVYPIITKAVNAQAMVTRDKNWGHDLGAMQIAITNHTKMIFIANPNNPTGTWLTGDELKTFMQSVPQHVIVVLDEAYYEYASDSRIGAAGYPVDTISWIEQFPNLVITRTFSKAYGLAGLRVGYSVSHPAIADMLNRVRQPFNVNSLALCAAFAALSDKAHLEKSIGCNADGMAQLVDGFKRLGLGYIPSVGNFICVDIGEYKKSVYHGLLEMGVIVRPVSGYEMPNYLRVSVGTFQENARFLQSLQSVLKTMADASV